MNILRPIDALGLGSLASAAVGAEGYGVNPFPLDHPNFSTPACDISAPGSVGVIGSGFGTAYSRIGVLRGGIGF